MTTNKRKNEMTDKEKRNLQIVGKIASQYGFGNVIAYLQGKWMAKLRDSGLSKVTMSDVATTPYPTAVVKMIEEDDEQTRKMSEMWESMGNGTLRWTSNQMH